MSDQIKVIEFDGIRIPLGLLVPDVRPTTFAAYSDSQVMLNRDEIQLILSDKRRRLARDMFGGSEWIKSQGNRGSCNGYAGAKALERVRVKEGRKHIALSGEGLYAQINNGRDAGSMLDDGMEALMQNGVPPESMVPREEFLWSRISSEARQAMKQFKARKTFRADTNEELASGLAAGFVGVVAVHVGNDFTSLDGDGRVRQSLGPGNHAVCVDDVRIFNGKYEYDMANSWGLRYGTNGRGWVSWDRHLSEPSKYHAFYLIRSASDDDSEDQPPRFA